MVQAGPPMLNASLNRSRLAGTMTPWAFLHDGRSTIESRGMLTAKAFFRSAETCSRIAGVRPGALDVLRTAVVRVAGTGANIRTHQQDVHRLGCHRRRSTCPAWADQRSEILRDDVVVQLAVGDGTRPATSVTTRTPALAMPAMTRGHLRRRSGLSILRFWGVRRTDPSDNPNWWAGTRGVHRIDVDATLHRQVPAHPTG